MEENHPHHNNTKDHLSTIAFQQPSSSASLNDFSFPPDGELWENYNHLLPLMIDAHNHLQESFDPSTFVSSYSPSSEQQQEKDEEEEGNFPNLFFKKVSEKLTLKGMLIMGTRPEDWPVVKNLCDGWNEYQQTQIRKQIQRKQQELEQKPLLLKKDNKPLDERIEEEEEKSDKDLDIVGTWMVPGYGCHPWFAHLTQDPQDLISNLNSNYFHHHRHVLEYQANKADVVDDDKKNLDKDEEEGQEKNKIYRKDQLHSSTSFDINNPFSSKNIMILGEIGLDKISIDRSTGQKHPFDKQLPAFTNQFKFAVENELPLSIHCVKTWDDILIFLKEYTQELIEKDEQELQEDGIKNMKNMKKKKSKKIDLKKWLPNIMLHSFPGSPETIQRFETLPYFGSSSSSSFSYIQPKVESTSAQQEHQNHQKKKMTDSRQKDTFYYSTSFFVNARQPTQKWIQRIQSIPNHKVLIESDLGQIDTIPLALIKAAWMVSVAKGWSMEETVKRTSENALRFLKRRV